MKSKGKFHGQMEIGKLFSKVSKASDAIEEKGLGEGDG